MVGRLRVCQSQVGDDLVGRRVYPAAFGYLEPGRRGYPEHDDHYNNSSYHLDEGKAALVFPGPLPAHLSHSRPRLLANSEPFRASEFFRTFTAEATVRDVLRCESPSFFPISV